MKASYYNDKSLHYGMGHTRLRRVLELAGDVKGKKILDVGCARGYLGELFKGQGASYVAGIEISTPAGEQARVKLDKVWVFDVQDDEWPQDIKKEQFDLIIMAEVLEHVFDPSEVVKMAGSILAPEGSLIVTTPNFMTWTNRIKFLFGKFRYENQGMFDFGHIRFFTYEYLKRVLYSNGFVIDKERHIIFPGKATAVLRYWPSLFAYQFIIRVRKV